MPNVIRVTYAFTVGEDVNAQVRQFYAYTGSAPTSAQLVTTATDVRGPVYDLFATLMDADTSATTLTIEDLSSDLGAVGVATGTTVGSRAGGELGADTAALVNYVIGRHYRGGKPRSYWPFGTSTDLASRGLWSSDFVGTMDTSMSTIQSEWAGAGVGGFTVGGQVNVSYYQGFTPVVNPITLRTRDVAKPRTVAIAPDIVTAAVCSPKVASQRRRDLQRR
jgi:hypothetical protein